MEAVANVSYINKTAVPDSFRNNTSSLELFSFMVSWYLLLEPVVIFGWTEEESHHFS